MAANDASPETSAAQGADTSPASAGEAAQQASAAGTGGTTQTPTGASSDAAAAESGGSTSGETGSGPETGTEGGSTGGDSAFIEGFKKLALALSDGSAVKMTADEARALLGRLLERSELAGQDARRLLADVGDWVRKTAGGPVGRAREAAENLLRGIEEGRRAAAAPVGSEQLTERLQASIERVLRAMHIASRSDLEQLQSAIERLDAKVQELLEKCGAQDESEPAGGAATS